MSDAPLISVLMTTYKNDQSAVCRSIESILNQTFSDFEFIVIFEPGDSVFDLVRNKYIDKRLVLIANDTWLGRSGSYNLGLHLARGRYLARMDADDYAYPERLERQMMFFGEHPDIAVLGTDVRIIDVEGQDVGRRAFPTSHSRIMNALTFITPMCHPTIVWDRNHVGWDIQYAPRFSRFCDDLELFLRLMRQGHKFANLPVVLLDYQQINNHRRPRDNWIFNYMARKLHWGLGLRYPQLLLGLLFYRILTLMPHYVVDLLTGRNWLSDKLRYVKHGSYAS